jgi:hypothetical protein
LFSRILRGAVRWPRGLRRRFAKAKRLLGYLIENSTKSLAVDEF